MGPGGVFLTAAWRHLVMLNYEVDPGLVLGFVPAGTELDRWNGRVFISLVGFRFLQTKVFGLSIPFHRNFDEVNLRFYVRRREGSQVRRGVVFIREIVPRWAIAMVARTLYNENYVAMPMSHDIRQNGEGGLAVEYGWRTSSGWNKMKLTARGDPGLPKEGSLEQFITEHFWGYAARKEYRVAHELWRVRTGDTAMVEGRMEELYGPELAAVLETPPTSALLAEGSNVSVHRGRTLT